MSAPTLDRNPETTSTGTSAGHRRRRKQLVLVASALLVLAVAVGTSLAIATRPVAGQAPAGAGVSPVAAAADQDANANQNATTGQGATAQPTKGNPAGTPTKSSDQGSTGTSSAPALPDGDHDAYITSIDRANNRIVVDVVQVFNGDQAVAAAIADGKPRSEAQYLYTWVRNQNPRLRTLPLASDLVIKLHDGCEGSRGQLLSTLAADARQRGLKGEHPYYFTLTVAGGKVQRIQEWLAINAC